MSSFLSEENVDKKIKTLNQLWIKFRKNRFEIGSDLVKFSVGDIVTVRYWNGCDIYSFEGICISVRRKRFNDLNATIILRNVLMGIGIEVTVSYYYNRILAARVSDHKRKKFIY